MSSAELFSATSVITRAFESPTSPSRLHLDLRRRGIPSFDDSANLNAWNATCLQRHIQQVRMERVLCIGALVASGMDVLHTDATVAFVGDVLPFLRAQPADVRAERVESWGRVAPPLTPHHILRMQA